MNYAKIYDNLVARARGRVVDGYTEKHHIMPRCMGGSDDTENLVRLTASEHFLAHQLLVKMHPDEPKLAFAARMLTQTTPGCDGRINNKMFSWLRERAAKANGDIHRGKPVSEYKRMRISEGKKNGKKPPPQTAETRLKRSIACKSTKRSGGVWDFDKELYAYWVQSGKLKASRFTKWLHDNSNLTFTYNNLRTLVYAFEHGEYDVISW